MNLEKYKINLLEDIDEQLETINIPPHMVPGLKTYLLYGQCGSFLKAVMGDHFKEAAGRADQMNQAALFEWASVLYNIVPFDAQGEHVDEWMKGGGYVGRFNRNEEHKETASGKEKQNE